MLCNVVGDTHEVKEKELTPEHFDLWYGVINSMGKECYVMMFAVCEPYGYIVLERKACARGMIQKIIDFFLLRRQPQSWAQKMREGLLTLSQENRLRVTYIVVYDRSLQYYHQPRLTIYSLPKGMTMSELLQTTEAGVCSEVELHQDKLPEPVFDNGPVVAGVLIY